MANYKMTNYNLYFFFMITSLPICTAFIPFIVKLVSWCHLLLFCLFFNSSFWLQILKLTSYSSKVVNLQNQILQLEGEKQQISMVQQFAKYSKIERRINKLKQECKVISKLSLICSNDNLITEPDVLY